MALTQFQKHALERRLGPAPSVTADLVRADAEQYLRNQWRGDRAQAAAATPAASRIDFQPRPLLNDVGARRLREGLKSSVPTSERARHDALSAITGAWRNRGPSPTPSQPTPAAQGFGGRSASAAVASTMRTDRAEIRVDDPTLDTPETKLRADADRLGVSTDMILDAAHALGKSPSEVVALAGAPHGWFVWNRNGRPVYPRRPRTDKHIDASGHEDDATTEAKQRTVDARERFLSEVQNAWKRPQPAPVDAR